MRNGQSIRKKLIVRSGWSQNINECISVTLNPGDNFHVPVGLIHQMEAVKDTEMFEFSTQHFDEDSYRVIKGDQFYSSDKYIVDNV